MRAYESKSSLCLPKTIGCSVHLMRVNTGHGWLREIAEGEGTLILCRHPETDWNAERRFQSTSRPLSARGYLQLEALIGALLPLDLGRIIDSGTHQAQVVASELARRSPRAQLFSDARLKEIDHGSWEGLTFAEVSEQWSATYQERFAAPLTSRVHGGETLADVGARVKAWADEMIAARSADDRVTLVVAHATPIQAIIAAAAGAGLEDCLRFRVDHAGLSAVRLHESARCVLFVNHICDG